MPALPASCPLAVTKGLFPVSPQAPLATQATSAIAPSIPRGAVRASGAGLCAPSAVMRAPACVIPRNERNLSSPGLQREAQRPSRPMSGLSRWHRRDGCPRAVPSGSTCLGGLVVTRRLTGWAEPMQRACGWEQSGASGFSPHVCLLVRIVGRFPRAAACSVGAA